MKLQDYEVKKLEDYWKNIEEYKKKMRFREWELLHPHVEEDINMGGGKSNKTSDSTANKAMILAEDEEYQKYKKIVTTIEQLYEELDNDQKTIVQMRYWDKYGCYEWEDIAAKLFMSRSKVLRRRNVIIDETAKRLNWV